MPRQPRFPPQAKHGIYFLQSKCSPSLGGYIYQSCLIFLSFDVLHQLASGNHFIQILLSRSTQMDSDRVYSNPYPAGRHR